MTSFLFWNIQRNGTSRMKEVLAALIAEFELDFLILAESPFDSGTFSRELRKIGREFRDVTSPYVKSKTQIYTKHPAKSVRTIFDSNRGGLTIRELRFTTRNILLAAVHSRSKLRSTERGQDFLMRNEVVDGISKAEDMVGYRSTIAVGDFNMDPYEGGMADAGGLHAVMTKSVALKEERNIDGKPYSFFYNPMWGLFGDNSPGPAGTYYRWASAPDDRFWHIFDQVLIRPRLIDSFRSVAILDRMNGHAFVNSDGIPDGISYSDHLPVFFRLDLL